MITAYMLVAMWASFVFGAGAHAVVEDLKGSNNQSVVYKVGVDYESGRTHSICEEMPQFREDRP